MQNTTIQSEHLDPPHKHNTNSSLADGHTSADSQADTQADTQEDTQLDTRCGYCGVHPACLQKLNGPLFLVMCTCIYSATMGFIVNGVSSVMSSTLEKRFNMTSSMTGYIVSSYNVTAVIGGLILGKYAHRNKARYFAVMITISSFGSFMYALPHFATGLYRISSDSGICSKPTPTACSETTVLARYFFVFLLGQLCLGAGGTSLFTVAASLLDDCVMPNTMPLVLGCVYASNVVGMGFGFFLGSRSLRTYVDFDKVDVVTIKDTNPQWVGAWWPPYLVGGVLQLMISLPLFGFGTELPVAENIRKKKESLTHFPSRVLLQEIKEEHKRKQKTQKLSTLETYKVLLTNPCFMLVLVALSVEGSFLSGSAAFMAKYMQTIYRLGSSEAGMYAGVAILPSAMIGLISGGLLAKKFKFTIKGSLKFVLVMNILAILGIHCIFIKCDTMKVFGVDKEYSGDFREDIYDPGLKHTCNEHCSYCTTDSFEPICSKKSGLYFSPCFAGCTEVLEYPNKTKLYSNCLCIKEIHKVEKSTNDNTLNITDVHNVTMNKRDMTLTDQDCLVKCRAVYLFSAVMFVAMLFSFLPMTPLDSVTFRCVSSEQKSEALGLKTLIVRLVGSFCGPNVVGKLIDSSCVVWRHQCGERSSCWLYESRALTLMLYIFIIASKVIVLLCICLAHKVYKKPDITRPNPIST